MKQTFAIILFTIVTVAAFSQSPAEEKVWQRVEALSKAVFDTKDSVALLDLVDSKVTYGHSGGNLEDKATMVRNAAGSKSTYKNGLFERVSILVEGITAIVRHNFRAITVDEKGAETPLNIGILQVWVNRSGKWRLLARQAVKIPEKTKS